MATAFTTQQANGQNTTLWMSKDFVSAEIQYSKEMTALQVRFMGSEVSVDNLIAHLESGKKVVYQANGFGVKRFVTWECIPADGSFRRIEVVCK